MKRILLSTVLTVLGLVALLSFKSRGHPLGVIGGALPSAVLSTGPSSTAPAGSPSTSSAPPVPGRTSSSASATTAPATQTIDGAPVETQYGIVQVRVTLNGTRITNVSFVQLQAFDDRSQQINSYAAPILLQETLAAQSAHVDSVSGASYTSQGYMQSLQSALDAAKH